MCKGFKRVWHSVQSKWYRGISVLIAFVMLVFSIIAAVSVGMCGDGEQCAAAMDARIRALGFVSDHRDSDYCTLLGGENQNEYRTCVLALSIVGIITSVLVFLWAGIKPLRKSKIVFIVVTAAEAVQLAILVWTFIQWFIYFQCTDFQPYDEAISKSLSCGSLGNIFSQKAGFDDVGKDICDFEDSPLRLIYWMEQVALYVSSVGIVVAVFCIVFFFLRFICCCCGSK